MDRILKSVKSCANRLYSRGTATQPLLPQPPLHVGPAADLSSCGPPSPGRTASKAGVRRPRASRFHCSLCRAPKTARERSFRSALKQSNRVARRRRSARVVESPAPSARQSCFLRPILWSMQVRQWFLPS
jgi:hypothetical protein